MTPSPAPGPRRSTRRVLVVLGLVGLLVATLAVARAGAQQPGTQPQLLASRTPDRANPAPLQDLVVAEGAVYVFAHAPPDTAWVAFYLDLEAPGQLSEPIRVEHQAPFDLAGTLPGGQATPLETAAPPPGTHRITAILHRSDGRQQLLTATFQARSADDTPTPTPAPTPTPPPSTTQPPTRPPDPDPAPQQLRIGLHQDLHYGVRDGAVQAAKRLGATVSRSSFLWDKIEPEQGQRDWSSSDAFINQLVAAGMQPLLYFAGSPSWANGSSDRFAIPTDQAAFDAWVRQYATFAHAAAARYQDTVSLWEIGNEPNQDDFWKPTPDAARYRQWYVAMRQAVLRGNPNAQVAVGGLTGLAASCCIRGLDFLTQLLQHNTPMDAVAIHPYPGQGQAPDAQVDGDNDFGDIAQVHKLLTDAGLEEVPLWVTEWGWSSGQVGEPTQARYVADSIRQLRAQHPYVTVATYFLDYDRPEFDHGLLRSDLTPKPAANAFTDAVQDQEAAG